jgi:hypothetical protein
LKPGKKTPGHSTAKPHWRLSENGK